MLICILFFTTVAGLVYVILQMFGNATPSGKLNLLVQLPASRMILVPKILMTRLLELRAVRLNIRIGFLLGVGLCGLHMGLRLLAIAAAIIVADGYSIHCRLCCES